MPRSFLLRRSFAANQASVDGSKVLSKGYKKGVLQPEKSQAEAQSRFMAGKNIFCLSNTNNNATNVSYKYQSFIDGNAWQKSNGHQTLFDVVTPPEKIRLEATKIEPEMNREIPTPANGLRPVYKCEQCGKIFKTKYTLTIHLKMPNHTGARPFVCNICGKGFRLSSTLCRHKIIHTSEKPHKCHVCQKAFNRSSTLKTHIRTHSEKKEFVCDVCGKGFHQKGNLRNHLLIHTGEKPYNCRLCNKAFNKLSNLKFHLHVHTDNTPYRCRYCKTAFSRRCDLKQHIRSTHEGNDSDMLDESDDI